MKDKIIEQGKNDYAEENPGSEAARAHGCICPVMDNCRGKGYLGGVKGEGGKTVFVINCDCPLHGGD